MVCNHGCDTLSNFASHNLWRALKPPGYHQEWHIGVRVKSNNKLVAFISGVPISLRVRGKYVSVTLHLPVVSRNASVFTAAEINYLCVHKKLRSKRLAPVLIKEVTRRCHLKGVFQAIYTAGLVLPTPVSTCRSGTHLTHPLACPDDRTDTSIVPSTSISLSM